MSSGPEIKFSLFGGICRDSELPKTRKLHVTNPMWRDGESRGRGRCSSSGGLQTQSQLKQQDFHPSASSLLSFSFLWSPPLFSVCTDNCSKRCQLAKAAQRRRKKVPARSNPGELEKKEGRLRFLSLSLCLSNSPVS